MRLNKTQTNQHLDSSPLFDRSLHAAVERLLPGAETPEFFLLQAAVARRTVAEQACTLWVNWALNQNGFKLESRLLPQLYRRFFSTGGQFYLTQSENPKLQELVNSLQLLQEQLWVRNQLLTREVVPVVAEMLKANIPLLALKGFAMLLRYAPEGNFRYLGDIDLAVPFNRSEEAIRHLERCGWVRQTCKRANEERLIHGAHFQNARQGKLDLHWHVLGLWPRDEVDQQIWDRGVPASILGNNLLVPSRIDMLFHVLIHGAGYVRGEPYWVLDAHKLIEQGLSNEDFAVLVELAKETKTVRQLAKAFLVLERCEIELPLLNWRKELEAQQLSLIERLEQCFDLYGVSKFRGTVPVRIAEFLRSDIRSKPGFILFRFVDYLKFHWHTQTPLEFWNSLKSKIKKLIRRIFSLPE